MNKKNYLELENRYGAHNYHPLPIVITRGAGCFVTDINGKKYLDCLSAYSALNLGHRHPAVIKELKKQATKLTLTSRAFMNDQLGPWYRELINYCAVPGLTMALPMNTGAEAVETAIKAARLWGYQKKKIARNQARIIVAADNFHGRTTTIVSFSTEPLYRDGFGPYAPGFDIVPYGNTTAIKNKITKNTTAIMLEPIQGEAGIILPPAGYLQEVFRLCQKNNILLLLDEIQTGFGRTGKKFAFQHERGVKPDLLILGKALGGGVMPISAVVGKKQILSLFQPGSHGSTFGANPLACAVSRKALEIMTTDRLEERSEILGQYLIDNLRKIKSPYIDHIRGKGLFVGIVLKPHAGGARRFCERLASQGVLLKETHEHVIRVAPPLTITKKDLDMLIKKLTTVLTK